MYWEHPCLWNVKSEFYKDRNKRAVALTAITKEMQKTYASVTTGDIKKKLDTIRNQHRREMRLEQNSRKSGTGTDDVYTPKLWCFDDLSFLNDSDIMRPSLSNVDPDTSEAAVEEHSDYEIFNDPLLTGEDATSSAPRIPVMLSLRSLLSILGYPHVQPNVTFHLHHLLANDQPKRYVTI